MGSKQPSPAHEGGTESKSADTQQKTCFCARETNSELVLGHATRSLGARKSEFKAANEALVALTRRARLSALERPLLEEDLQGKAAGKRGMGKMSRHLDRRIIKLKCATQHVYWLPPDGWVRFTSFERVHETRSLTLQSASDSWWQITDFYWEQRTCRRARLLSWLQRP